MKTFTILGEKKLIEYVTYTVEAETEEEALEMVENGDVYDNGDHWTTEIGGGETYTIQQ